MEQSASPCIADPGAGLNQAAEDTNPSPEWGFFNTVFFCLGFTGPRKKIRIPKKYQTPIPPKKSFKNCTLVVYRMDPV